MSDLLKMKRLVDGDDHFAWRVEAACWVEGVEFTPTVLRKAAATAAVLADTDLDEDGTVNSEKVADTAIRDAVAAANTSRT